MSQEKNQQEKKSSQKSGPRYWPGLGRRKSATAQARLYQEKDNQKIIINQKDLADYFPQEPLQQIVKRPFEEVGQKFATSIKVKGGGVKGQAEAIQLALSRALLEINPDYKKTLKRAGLLTRDPREKERKKPGLRKARRAPQWSKR